MNSAMRRPTRRGLSAALLLLVLLCGLYAGFWFVAASRIADGFTQWAQSQRAQNLDLSWRSIAVRGFPLAFAVELSEARLRAGPANAPGGELTVPRLSAVARPWNFRRWELVAPVGLGANAGPVGLRSASAVGSLAVGGEGGVAAWLRLTDPSADAGVRLAARELDLWLTLPARPPEQHDAPAFGVALDLRQLTVPNAPAPFPNPVDEIAFGITVMGAIPAAATPRQAAAAWRDAGGTVELDHLSLHWGALAISSLGTLALDRELQPIGGLSGAIEGYEALMSALVASGRIRAGDARLARLALAMLAKSGPGGQPQITTSFTIQNGQMFLGPARLGPAPRIDWP